MRPALRDSAPPSRSAPHGQHLGQDRHGRLGRGDRADVEPERAADAADLVLGVAGVQEPAAARVLRPAAAQRADVGDGRAQRRAERRLVEAGVVREHDDVGGLVGPVQVVGHRRPADHDLVGVGQALAGCELAARIRDDRAEADQLRDPAQGLGGVDGAEHHHHRRGRVVLDEGALVGADGRRVRLSGARTACARRSRLRGSSSRTGAHPRPAPPRPGRAPRCRRAGRTPRSHRRRAGRRRRRRRRRCRSAAAAAGRRPAPPRRAGRRRTRRSRRRRIRPSRRSSSAQAATRAAAARSGGCRRRWRRQPCRPSAASAGRRREPLAYGER